MIYFLVQFKQTFVYPDLKLCTNKVHTHTYFTFQSRHPNYFGEWMVWNSLIITSIPSIMALWQSSEETIITKVSFQ